jgi:hypothetical protein
MRPGATWEVEAVDCADNPRERIKMTVTAVSAAMAISKCQEALELSDAGEYEVVSVEKL